MKQTESIIKCPCCGREYLPGEIFLPNYLVGQPTEVLRGLDGEILSHSGQEMDLEETYVCDGCKTKFKVKAEVSFTAEVVKDIFDEDDFEVPTKE